MDKQIKLENSSLLCNKEHESSPRKPLAVAGTAAGGGGGGGGDRLKRDEWSEGAVSSLLEAYEAKWVLRNRAKLKGHDWEDVARYVSSRANSGKSPKTQTQCKNKIESMKKRYRSESATSDVSSWPLFPRLDLLLRGTSGPSSSVPPTRNLPLMVAEHAPPPAPPQLHSPASVPVPVPAPTPTPPGTAYNSIDFNGDDRENKKNTLETKLPSHQEQEKVEIETDSSTPALYSNDKEKLESKNHKPKLIKKNDKKKRKKDQIWDIAESIQWLGKVVVSTEKTRIETMKEIEKMRVEAEVKRGEIDLKRTEIIANTQLEIARLFARGVDPSLRIGRN